jgi:hypothetical protein
MQRHPDLYQPTRIRIDASKGSPPPPAAMRVDVVGGDRGWRSGYPVQSSHRGEAGGRQRVRLVKDLARVHHQGLAGDAIGPDEGKDCIGDVVLVGCSLQHA